MCAQCTTIPLYSAIDIGKNVHWFGGEYVPEIVETLPVTLLLSIVPYTAS